jgi:putative tryptophan/tyrosine transport system substrate-binding protein
MKRREFITLAGSAGAYALSSSAVAQGKTARIGFVSFQSPALAGHVEYLREGLRQLGYSGARAVEIESHFTDGNRQRTREVLQALVQKNVDVIVVWTSTAIQIAKEVTQTVPLVMIIAADPVAAGFVKSLPKPGGNLTGVSMSGAALAGKRLELLREIMPSIKTAGYLAGQTSGTPQFLRETRENAATIGLNIVSQSVAGADGIDAALFERMKRDGAEAIVAQPILTGYRDRIIVLATAARLPVISDYPLWPEAGALASLGVDQAEPIRRAAYYVDRILKGEKPADLPIEQPTRFELVINLKTAKALGIEVPPLLVARADKVIE